MYGKQRENCTIRRIWKLYKSDKITSAQAMTVTIPVHQCQTSGNIATWKDGQKLERIPILLKTGSKARCILGLRNIEMFFLSLYIYNLEWHTRVIVMHTAVDLWNGLWVWVWSGPGWTILIHPDAGYRISICLQYETIEKIMQNLFLTSLRPKSKNILQIELLNQGNGDWLLWPVSLWFALRRNVWLLLVHHKHKALLNNS